jgi:hypothetical protein
MDSKQDRIATAGVAESIDSTWETNEFYELEEAEVVDVILNDSHPDYKQVDDIGKIKIRKIHSGRDADESGLNWAKPISRTFCNIPVKYETVLVGDYINKNASGSIESQESYYINTFNVFGSINQNSYPNVSLSKEKATKTEEAKDTVNKYSEAEIGNSSTTKEDNNPTEYFLGDTFVKNENIHPLQPYEGDLIVQGRFGNSIRFGSTVKIIKSNENLTWWSENDSNGDPIIIIRNGENDESKQKEKDKPVTEDVDKDYSSIYLTSTQKIKIKKSGMGNPTWGNESQKELTVDDYDGKQIIMNTDRVVLNAKEREILGFSKMNIGWSTENNFTVDAKKLCHINAPKIYLGLDANKDGEPIVMGNKMVDLLSDMISAILNIKYNYSYVPGTELQLISVRNRLKDILSTKNYTQ